MPEEKKEDWWSLWSLPRRWQKRYSDVFNVLFIAGIVYTLVYEGCLDRSFDDAAKTVMDVVHGIAAIGIGAAALALVGIGGSMAIAEWLGRRKFAEGKAEGKAESKAEVNAWIAWNARREEAARLGKPFDEPPPLSADRPARRP